MRRKIFGAGELVTADEYKAIVRSGLFAPGEIVSAERLNEYFDRIFGDEMTQLYDLLEESHGRTEA